MLCPLAHMALIASGSSPTAIVCEAPSVICARPTHWLKTIAPAGGLFVKPGFSPRGPYMPP